MIPFFTVNDKNMFYKYLDNAKIYFEYGSGGSTYQASLKKNIKKIYSVESDLKWHNQLKSILQKNKKQKKKIVYLFNEMKARPKSWGYPGKKATDEQKINYSNKLSELKSDEQKSIDLILIDGRFRVACCLKSFGLINQDCLIAFDDFLIREPYHVVLDFFDIIEKSDDNKMVILKKKNNVKNVPKELIKKYELNPF